MMDEQTEVFDWGSLGEAWWREAGKVCKARTEQQVKFACVKHAAGTGKVSLGVAARLAGYQGDEESIRQSGYKANHTTAVQEMLALAAADDKTTPTKVFDRAARLGKLSEMAESLDPGVSLRAIEGLNKMEEREVELGRAVDDDGFGDWRLVRDYLQMSNGAAAIVHLWTGLGHGLSNFPLFHDVHKAITQSDPDLWERIVRNSNASERVTIERQLSNPDWQIEARIKIWREIGTDIVPSVPGMNGKVLATPSTSGNEQAVVAQFNGSHEPADVNARG